MRKSILTVFFFLGLVFIAAGCSSSPNGGAKTSKAYVFSVDTGDKVRIELDTTDGYDLTSNLPFEILQDDTTLSQGVFIEAEQFASYVEAVENDAKAKVIESSVKDSNQYVFWSYDDAEFDIVILINDSNTGILLGNAVSEESARECFDRLTISLDKE